MFLSRLRYIAPLKITKSGKLTKKQSMEMKAPYRVVRLMRSRNAFL